MRDRKMSCECGVETKDGILCAECVQTKRDEFHTKHGMPLDTRWPPDWGYQTVAMAIEID